MLMIGGKPELTKSPLGFPLEPGSGAAPVINAGKRRAGVRALRLVEPAPTSMDIDRVREMCHDMRQPVASIIVLAEAALSEAATPSAVRARLGQVIDQAEWLGDMLQHLLDTHEVTADRKSHDLTRIATDMVHLQQVTYRGDLRLQCGGGNMNVLGNPVHLRRAIANLLSNATRAAGPDGRVAVELHRAGDRVLLMVDDNGPGFGLIRRGAGLGLRGVVRSLKSLGGRIEYSRSPIGGVRATLALPAIGE